MPDLSAPIHASISHADFLSSKPVSELTVKPATELLAMLQRRTISSVELAAEHLREIERLNPQLHAFVDFDPERVLHNARVADESRRHPPAVDPPLLGLPVSIKASIATAGYRCEIGTALNRGFIPDEDAVAVQRLQQAGAVVLGTTNCPEFLMAYETDNLLYGATANPWNIEHTSGGSSGGESSAIAAGLSAAGIGSDSGGSVREPAHFTGICTLKPTSGRIPAKGHLLPNIGPFSTLGAIGPMARTMEDVSLLFQILSNHAADNFAAQTQQSPTLQQLRSRPLGVLELEGDGLIPVTPETREALHSAAHALEEGGFTLVPFRSSQLERARQLWWTFFIRCARMLLEPAIAGHESELSPTFRYYLDVARREPLLTGDELLHAWGESDEVRALLTEEMQPFSAILTPVCSVPAFRHGERAWQIEGQTVEYFSAMRFTQWFNLLGSPAAVVPVGSSADGLPIGVQIASYAHQDETVLAIAGLLDRDFGYRPPPLESF